MRNILAGLFILYFLASCGGGGSSSFVTSPSPEKLTTTGAGSLGIFDPSVTRDPNTNRLWMSYSSIEVSNYHPSSTYWAVSIRLASSVDNGVSWQDEGEVVASEETLLGPFDPMATITADSEGTWQSEMSSLIYDPEAAAGEEWKLIWLQYLHVGSTSFFADHAWINIKMAAQPSDLVATATTVKLFGGFGLKNDGSNTGSPVYSPTGNAPAIQLNTELTQTMGGADVTELNLCIFAEPGLHATDSALYLTTYCADAANTPPTEYLVHFSCTSPCDITNAASWEYLGRLLTPADAVAATGLHHYQAPAIVEKANKHYLLATPVDTTSAGPYSGCRVYEFVDINTNELRRDTNSDLIEIARADGIVDTHNGACAAFNGLSGGILLSQFNVANTTDKFTIYKSQVSLP